MYTYYSILRPIAPGTYPSNKEVVTIVNFYALTFIPDINRYAWGFITFEEELTEQEIRNYELVAEKRYECYFCGETYTKSDLKEFREMKEVFNKKPFICPDCYDDFQRLSLEEQAELLLD